MSDEEALRGRILELEQALAATEARLGELERTETALSESRHLVQQILSSTPNLIYIYDLDEHRSVYANRSIVEYLGYAPHDVVAMGPALFDTLLHPDDAAAVAAQHHRLASGAEIVLEHEYRMRHANGAWHWFRSRDVPFALDASGRVRQILGSAEDITEQRAFELALQESDALVRSQTEELAFLSRSATAFLDIPDERDVYALIGELIGPLLDSDTILTVSENDSVANRFRPHVIRGLGRVALAVHGLLGRDPLEMTGSFGPQATLALSTGRLVEVTDGLYDFAGGTLSAPVAHAIEGLLGLKALYVLGFVKEGRSVGGMCLLLRGKAVLPSRSLLETFASQAGAAIARRQSEQAQRESEQRYRDLFDFLPIPVYESDLDGTILSANRECLRIFGYDAAQIPRGYNLSQMVAPEDRERARQSLSQVISTGQAPGAEYAMLRQDGSRFPAIVVSGLVSRAGSPRGFRGAIVDITEQRRAETTKASLQAQLHQSQKMEGIGRLAGGIAHDFNNLLTVILSFSGFIKASTQAQDPLFDDVTEIESAANRAVALTRQLLAYSRKSIIKPQVIDLNAALMSLDKMLKRILGEDIVVQLDLAPDVGRVVIDPGHLDQIVVNLAVNARDAMPNGGRFLIRTAALEVEAGSTFMVKPGPYGLVEIGDTGVGMPPEVQEHLFEPFFTTKEKGKGTGLGLSTVYGTVKQAGGDIRATSSVGQGSTFALCLPVTTAPLSSSARDAAEQNDALAGATVLVVDDEEGLCKVVRRALEEVGCAILSAGGGPQALRVAAVHTGRIDLLISDVVMPGMSGSELASRLRATHPEVAVLYMSGFPDDAIARHGVLERGVTLLPKPFSATALVAKANEVLLAAKDLKGRG